MANSNPLLRHPRYETIKHLGSGTYGRVILARDSIEDRMVAIKLLNRGSSVTEYVFTELLNHSRLHHPHIIKLREVFLTAHHLAIVLEFADQGDMFSYVTSRKRLEEHLALWFFQQLIVGLDYLHRMNICSRDIKLENTLVKGSAQSPVLKICDFGFSKNTDEQSQAQTRVGTFAYMAPEISMHGVEGYDGMAADVWSAGVILYVMLVGRYPFERPEDARLADMARTQRTIQRILARDVVFPTGITPECRDLLDRLLTLDPAHRITVAQIQAHPWYRRNLPKGVLGMNEPLLAQRVPADVMEAHKTRLRRVVDEAKKRLAYNAPPLPYEPVATPVPPSEPEHAAPTRPSASVAPATGPPVAPPVVPPPVVAPPAAPTAAPPPKVPAPYAAPAQSPMPVHAPPVRPQPRAPSPMTAATPTAAASSTSSARSYVPYPQDRFSTAPVPHKREGMLASSTRHSLVKCKEMFSAARKSCQKLFSAKT